MNEYWIGDCVKILTSGKTGKYEGTIKGKARVKVENRHIIISFSNLELIPEELLPSENHTLTIINKPAEKAEKTVFGNTLDLHIQKLNPAIENEIPELILAFQIKKAQSFIEDAIKRKQYSIILIHGKGLGALKMEVEHLLQNYKELNYFIPTNDGGATQAFFKYY